MTKPFEPLPCPDAKIYIDLTKLSMCKIWLICVLPMARQITPVLILASLNAPWVTAQDLDWPKSPPVKRPNYWVVTCNICNQQWQSLNLASQWLWNAKTILLLWHHQPINKNGEDALDSGFNVNCDWETQSGKGGCLLALLSAVVSPWLLPGHHDLGSLHDLKADQHTATAASTIPIIFIRSCLVEVSSPSTFSATLTRRASPQSCPNFPPNGPSPSILFL